MYLFLASHKQDCCGIHVAAVPSMSAEVNN